MKKILALVLVLSLSLSLLACQTTTSASKKEGGQQVDLVLQELQQNDYRGAYTRASVLNSLVLTMVDDMKSNNTVIRAESPNTYWSDKDYQDFVSTFFATNILNDTQWLNEEEGDSWEHTVSVMFSQPNSFTQMTEEGYARKNNVWVKRNEKDDYTIGGLSGQWAELGTTLERAGEYNGSYEWRVLYDCDNDWAKAYCCVEISNYFSKTYVKPCVSMFEYIRINDNTYAVQTATERMVVFLEPAESDCDLRTRKVTKFIYSRLNGGKRTTFEEFEPLAEFNEQTGEQYGNNVEYNSVLSNYYLLNDKGDLAMAYGYSDSMFNSDSIVNNDTTSFLEDWVVEDKALQQYIYYTDGVMGVLTYNKLTQQYEAFMYNKEGKSDKEVYSKKIEPLKDELVGVVPFRTNSNNLQGIETETEKGTEVETSGEVSLPKETQKATKGGN